MKEDQGYLVCRVTAGSPAAAAGITAGARLLRMDNRAIKDIIHYKIMEADEQVTLLLRDPNGRLRRLTISKESNTPLGLQFEPPTMAPVMRCHNRCLFCFVNQNPRGVRPSLYLKDDDYRLSFLYSNFITLNNLDEADLRRIIRLQLSPLYISVHATDPQVRRRLFRTARADRGLRYLRALTAAGIRVHLQLVLCPGYNTGAVLKKTIADLYRLGPAVLSIALVPVGLTAHRPPGAPPLRRLTPAEAEALVKMVRRYQQIFLHARGSRLIYLADEIYNLAGKPFPRAEAYEGFPQLENGVGLARQFLDELDALPRPPLTGPLPRPYRATLVTGREAAPLLRRLIGRFNAVPNLHLELAVAENSFFGPPVTVTGLLAGSDLLAALSGKDLGEALFISRVLFKEGSGLFLDDMTVEQLEEALKVPVRAVSGPVELAGCLAEAACQGSEPAGKEGAMA